MDIYGVGLDCAVRQINLQFRQFVAKMKGGLTLTQLKYYFNKYDHNKNTLLEPEEFEKALNEFGFFLKKQEVQVLFKFYDKDKSGALSYEEFVSGILQPLEGRRLAIVQKAFSSLDGDQTGIVDLETLKSKINFDEDLQLLQKKKSKEQLLEEYINTFKDVADKKVTIKEFYKYYQDISISIANEDHFVYMVENHWRIAENETSTIAKAEANRILKDLRAVLVKFCAGNKDDVLLQKLFKEFDINKDGYIGFDEFEHILSKYNVTYEKKYLTTCFKKIDVNWSGYIEFDEFFNFIVHDVDVY